MPGLPLSTYVTSGKLPNLSVPLFLISKMGEQSHLCSLIVVRILWGPIHTVLGTGPGVLHMCELSLPSMLSPRGQAEVNPAKRREEGSPGREERAQGLGESKGEPGMAAVGSPQGA